MKRLTALVIVTAFGAGAAWAASDAIAQRRELMHNDGIAAKKLFDMAKGTVPFDLAVAQASLKTLAIGAEKSPALFPDDSKTGGGTAALPAIWENKADFNARFANSPRTSTPPSPRRKTRRVSRRPLRPCSRIAAAVTSSTRPRAADLGLTAAR